MRRGRKPAPLNTHIDMGEREGVGVISIQMGRSGRFESPPDRVWKFLLRYLFHVARRSLALLTIQRVKCQVVTTLSTDVTPWLPCDRLHEGVQDNGCKAPVKCTMLGSTIPYRSRATRSGVRYLAYVPSPCAFHFKLTACQLSRKWTFRASWSVNLKFSDSAAERDQVFPNERQVHEHDRGVEIGHAPYCRGRSAPQSWGALRAPCPRGRFPRVPSSLP